MGMIMMEPVSRSGVLDLNMAARMSLPAARRRRGGRGGGGATYTCMEAEGRRESCVHCLEHDHAYTVRSIALKLRRQATAESTSSARANG